MSAKHKKPVRKIFTLSFLAFFLSIALVLSFKSLTNSLTESHIKIFELENQSSWVEHKKLWGNRSKVLIFEEKTQEAHNILLSKDIWSDVVFAFLITNPKNCGVVFNYQDPNNFYYFLYDTPRKQVNWGRRERGRSIVMGKLETESLPDSWPFLLRVKDAAAKIYFADQLICEVKLPLAHGKIGLMETQENWPQTLFSQFFAHGTTLSGPVVIDPANTFQDWIVGPLLYFWAILVGLAVVLRNLGRYVFKREERTSGRNSLPNILFELTAYFAAAWSFARIIQLIARLDVHQFEIVYLWKCLLLSFLAYGLLLVVAFLYSRLWNNFSTLFYFLGLIFFSYVLMLINLLTLKIPDPFFLYLTFIGLLLPIVRKWRRQPQDFRNLKITLKFSWISLLLGLWFIHSFLYLLESNFDLNRLPQSDELNFWFTAAANMIQTDIHSAHVAVYASNTIHSLGIPFLWAYPAKLFGVPAFETIYFGVIAVLLGFGLFLTALSKDRWCFLFFYVAFFDVINNHATWSNLMYSLIYGEAISILFLLVILYELFHSQERTLSQKEIWLACFGIGLLVLTKSPISYLSIVLIIVFLIVQRSNLKLGGKSLDNQLETLGVYLLFGLAPIFIWKFFSFCQQIEFDPFILAVKRMDLTANRFEMLKTVLGNLRNSYAVAAKYLFFGLVFILLTFKRKELLYLVPLALLSIVFFFYYAFIYTTGDDLSSARYILGVVISVFYLGGVGFSRWMGRYAGKSS